MNIFKGNTFQGTLKMRVKDPCNSGIMRAYPLNLTDLVEILFPGDSGSVILSTANSGEITMILSGGVPTGDVTFYGSATKGALLLAGNKQSINFRITNSVPSPATIFEGQINNVLNVIVPANS